MLSVLCAILVVLLFLLFLTQTISITIIKNSSFLLEFNFVFLAFSINLNNSNNKNARKKKRKRSSTPSYITIFRLLSFCLSGSHLKLRAFNFPSIKESQKSALTEGLVSIPRAALLSYLINSSASFEFIEHKCDSHTEIDATVYTPLIHLIFTALLYFKERHKIKHKARTKI